MGLDAVYLFIKVIPVFLFGIQSVWVTNVYLNFILTLVTMVLFALLLFQVIFKIGQFSIYFYLTYWCPFRNIFSEVSLDLSS